MKKKSKKAILKSRKQFRFKKIMIKGNKIMRHPAYIFYEKGNVYIYVNITHSSIVNGKIVIKLRKNPNPNDKDNSYYVEEIREDTKDSFGKRLHGWKLNSLDDAEIRELYKKR